MSYKNAREKIEDNEVELEDGAIILEEEIFIDSMIGVSHDDRIVYDYDKMVIEYAEKTGSTIDEAADYVSNGIIRWMNYYQGKAPIIMDSFFFDGSEPDAN